MSCNIHSIPLVSSLLAYPMDFGLAILQNYVKQFLKVTLSPHLHTHTHTQHRTYIPYIGSVSWRILINTGGYLYVIDEKEVYENSWLTHFQFSVQSYHQANYPQISFTPQNYAFSCLCKCCLFCYHPLECFLQLLWKSNSCPLMFSSSSTSQHGSLASCPVDQFELLAIPTEWQWFKNHALSIIKVNTNELVLLLVSFSELWAHIN